MTKRALTIVMMLVLSGWFPHPETIAQTESSKTGRCTARLKGIKVEREAGLISVKKLSTWMYGLPAVEVSALYNTTMNLPDCLIAVENLSIKWGTVQDANIRDKDDEWKHTYAFILHTEFEYDDSKITVIGEVRKPEGHSDANGCIEHSFKPYFTFNLWENLTQVEKKDRCDESEFRYVKSVEFQSTQANVTTVVHTALHAKIRHKNP